MPETPRVYLHAPGTVVRCARCDPVLIGIVRGDRPYWLDLTGVRCLEFRAPA
ncbi:MAG: DUF6510 family protein [Actinomycetota bacterium]|nr:DUF6510 family protein [Actinomycetota bacterium]